MVAMLSPVWVMQLFFCPKLKYTDINFYTALQWYSHLLVVRSEQHGFDMAHAVCGFMLLVAK